MKNKVIKWYNGMVYCRYKVGRYVCRVKTKTNKKELKNSHDGTKMVVARSKVHYEH